jgi:ankyrin repeat protein
LRNLCSDIYSRIFRFLLARLYIDSLRDKRRVKEVKLALAELPKGEEGLSKAYEDAFQRIETQMPGDRELAKKVLSWITLAKHPMTTTEICCALAVEPNESEIDPDNIPDSEDLQSVCAGLLVVDEKSTIIRLVHYTTQEYLEQTVDTWCPDGQLHIATTCLSYLALDVFQDDECYKPRKLATTLTRHPFLSYASKYWGHHAKVVEAEIIQVACAVRLRTAISCAGRFNRGSTIIHYLARFGLINMMKIVLSTPDEPGIMEIDVKDDHERTPLSYAAEYGYYEVVKFLLDKGVNANTEGGFYGTALQAASVGGHKQVVELLLDNGAEVDAKAGHYDIALHAASANGHEQVVELLLERGADIKAQDNDGYTALHAASDYGHEQITRLLLDRGVEINAQDKDGFTALHAVSEYGYEQLAKLVLDKGAEVNVQDLDGYIALHVALAEGHEQMIKLLLDRRAEVNVQGNGCADALQKASSRNHEQAVKLVLEAGADVSSKGPYHGIILHGFASWGNSQMVELLLAKGAEVDWHTENYASPLYIASEQDHGQVAEVLLKARADPNIQCGKHGNALFAASVHGYEDLVELLLENGADANAEGAIYPNSPLYAASSKGYAYIV